jgi:hypothetical protein
MGNIKICAVISTFVLTMALPALPDDLAAVKQALDAKYALTTTTADRTDIVTAGAVLVLKKSNLLTTDASKQMTFSNSYKNGRITQPKMVSLANVGGKLEGTRTFVSGEKVWLTAIDVKEKEIVFSLYTDAFGDTRYRGKLNFPLEKGEAPSANAVMAMVAEVFDIQQSEANNSGGGQQQQQPPPGAPRPAPAPAAGPAPTAAAAPADAPPPPIAPPPPPPADPKEIKLGQTPDQVTASIGQPDKIVKLGAKQIYVYKDMRVVFVGGKVSDVQ